jgi:hypothetical protein
MRFVPAFLFLIEAIVFAPHAFAFQESCERQATRTFDELITVWTWESFWDGKTNGFRYQSSKNAVIDVFWNANTAGMCSLELGSCTAYELRGTTVGPFLLATSRLREKDIQQATSEFLRKLSEPQVTQVQMSGDSRDHRDAGRFEKGGNTLSIPGPSSQVVFQRSASPFQTCVLTRQLLPALGLPRAIRDRIQPGNLGELEKWLKGRLHTGPGNSRSEYVIPYYAPEDPMIYVLVRVDEVTESVILILPDTDGAAWSIGGHFDAKESPAQLQRMERLILSAKMISVIR